VNYIALNLVHQPDPKDAISADTLKPVHMNLKPGDCVHIPAYWWYQISVEPVMPEIEAEEGEEVPAVDPAIASIPGLSVDFWY
jgi:hypothetical protein